MSSILDWAVREVEIACKKINPNRKEGEFDYDCACYESALKAFKSLCEDGHSGNSIIMTKNILNRLIDNKPLTFIEDTDDVWDLITEGKYQCKRMSSLFKTINADGTIKYSNVNSSYCIDIHDAEKTYYLKLVRDIIEEMFPITMPYMPSTPIMVYCEDFLTDKKNGDFDTFGIFFALKTKNGKQERIEINRFFRSPYANEEDVDWIEITKEEYEKRKNGIKEI